MDSIRAAGHFSRGLAMVRLPGRSSGGEPSRQQCVQVQWPDLSGIRDRSDSRGGGKLWGPESQGTGQHHQRVNGLDASEWFIKEREREEKTAVSEFLRRRTGAGSELRCHETLPEWNYNIIKPQL